MIQDRGYVCKMDTDGEHGDIWHALLLEVMMGNTSPDMRMTVSLCVCACSIHLATVVPPPSSPPTLMGLPSTLYVTA